MKQLDLNDIDMLYPQYVKHYEAYLKQSGVKFINYDYRHKKINQALFALMFLVKYINEVVTKQELTEGWNKLGKPTNDFQSARHLGLQYGYLIENSNSGISGYRLLTLTEPHPSFISNRRTQFFSEEEWEKTKQHVNNRCMTCGAFEGEKHYKQQTLIVKLEKGHCDPSKPLTVDNTFPQCNYCNRIYKNKFEFDKRGNVRKQIKFDHT
jgi:hypothetical protein